MVYQPRFGKARSGSGCRSSEEGESVAVHGKGAFAKTNKYRRGDTIQTWIGIEKLHRRARHRGVETFSKYQHIMERHPGPEQTLELVGLREVYEVCRSEGGGG